MNLSRRTLLKAALGMPAAPWVLNYRAAAAPFSGQVKIARIKTMGLDNVGDGCLVRIETDAGLIGYGEAGLPSAAARARVDMIAPQLIGQDPLAIERHFYLMASTQYSFMAQDSHGQRYSISRSGISPGRSPVCQSTDCWVDPFGRTSPFIRTEARRTCWTRHSAERGRNR